MLVDPQHRIISYLRISVTDRCNFRCVYCMPAEGVDLVPRDELLTFEEIARVAEVGAQLGLSKIRITGGEPTVRRDLPLLVRLLSSLDGISEICLTTNGSRLEELAGPLREAGLGRVNVSLDTLRPERARRIARRDFHPAVLRGIAAATAAGLTPLKINVVVLRGVNDDELGDLLEFGRCHNAQVRFIEYMPMGATGHDPANSLVTAEQMRRLLELQFALEPETGGDAHDPARGWVCTRTGARAAFISSMSDNFCATCNRMRLTAEGELRPCLHQNAEVPLRGILRGGGSDDEIVDAFREAAGLKWAGHHMNDFIPLLSVREMVAIGG